MLVDQIFQKKMSKPKMELDNNKYLEKALDNAWFKKGIALGPFLVLKRNLYLEQMKKNWDYFV
jgi:hypothetical protein